MAYDKPILNSSDMGGISTYGVGIVGANVIWLVNGTTTLNVNAVANINSTYNYNISEK
ncbi:MAG: hypothetical protein HFI75_05810 [Lachnospiraceae bacterium]|nr:hypothetical protein [Lachnospiraceae bacterium]